MDTEATPSATEPRERFAMVAKTFAGLEDVLAQEIRELPGAENVEPGNRMVSFDGDLETLYRANMCCRTAVRILKPLETFTAADTDQLYDRLKLMPWGEIIGMDKTFSIDSVVYSDVFTNSRYVTYRFKDAIVDWFRDRYGDEHRPRVRLDGADMMLNIHIAGKQVTISLDSSGESLHRRGWRTESTDAPINEVLAAGIILKTGWRGDSDFLDPMCGSGTFLVEAAMIAANIMPGIFRKGFAFESWPDFDRELFQSIYDDESRERDNFKGRIYGSDVSVHAIRVAQANLKSAGVARFVTLEHRAIEDIDSAPSAEGVLVTNPPYGKRLRPADIEGLYRTLGTKLKNVFQGWHAWIIGFNNEVFDYIGLAPSRKEDLFNGALECQLREFIMFSGDYRSFRAAGGSLGREADDTTDSRERPRRERPAAGAKGEPRRFDRGEKRFDRGDRRPGGARDERRPKGNPRYARPGDDSRRSDKGERRFDKDERRFDKGGRRFDKDERRFDKGEQPLSEAEQILGRRRNPYMLRGVTGKKPRLGYPGDEAPQRRRGWKKGGPASGDESTPSTDTPQ